MYRFLVVCHGSQWLAQGVDFDLAAQAPDEDMVVAAFVRALRAHRRRAHDLGLAAFSNLPQPPAKFVDAWDKFAKTTPVKMIRMDDEDDEMVPAYLAEALVRDGGFNLER